jgi:hypothetical protein
LKKLFLGIFTLLIYSCQVQEKKEAEKPNYYIVKSGDGTKIDTLWNPELIDQLYRISLDSNYRPTFPEDDTIFNAKGQPISIKMRDDIFGASLQKFEYDNQDRLIKITGYDTLNQIKCFSFNIAIQINKYDSDGNLVEIRNLGDDEKLIPAIYETTPIIQMKYNGQRQLMEVWHLNENGTLRDEFAIIKFEYTPDGKQIEKGWYNEKGVKEQKKF